MSHEQQHERWRLSEQPGEVQAGCVCKWNVEGDQAFFSDGICLDA
jgi:hypothetical protein